MGVKVGCDSNHWKCYSIDVALGLHHGYLVEANKITFSGQCLRVEYTIHILNLIQSVVRVKTALDLWDLHYLGFKKSTIAIGVVGIVCKKGLLSWYSYKMKLNHLDVVGDTRV